MDNLKDKSIALFFSYNVSLDVWKSFGMVTRESKIWSLFKENFKQIFFITYGDEKEYKLMEYFPDINLLNNKWYLNTVVYSFLLPIIYRKYLNKIDVYKVNQLSGALPAVISKILYKKKLIVRCGFQLSQFFKKQKENVLKIFLALLLERIAYSAADIITVTCEEDKKYILEHHRINPEKIKIVPNGIDTELFRVLDNVKKESRRLLFVGRLIKQKNLFSLLEALKDIKNIHLVMIGKGYLKEELKNMVKGNNLNVTFVDRVDNADLPIEYNKSEVFILPSYFEGNPKVLLEAMACGVAAICSDVEGLNSIIRHNHNGLLCQISAEAIGGM
ncbi:MAG: glycosyltransferase family 4 protein, partial [Candidatus Omnitrophica bacterium]|nr:glycosyltransferase family 4 protein [Candidatus Omnitrophota bacterium]